MAQDGRIDRDKNAKSEDKAQVKDGVSGNTAGAVTPKDDTLESQGVAAPERGERTDIVRKKGG